MRKVGLLAVLVSVTLIGCSDGGDGGSEGASTSIAQVRGTTNAVDATTSTTAAPTTTVDPDDPRAAILEAHKGFWDTWLAANNPPNPDHPGLRRYYTGEAYDTAVAAIEKNKREGIHLELPQNSIWEHTPLLVTLVDGGAAAVIQDCAIDDGLVIRSATGEVLNDKVMTVQYRTELELRGGQWMVSRNLSSSRLEGNQGCDLLP